MKSEINKFIDIFKLYMRYGYDRENARLNVLEDANLYGLPSSDRCRLSFLIMTGKVWDAKIIYRPIRE